MTSSSAFGISQITLQFDLGRSIDYAAQDVQAAINAARARCRATCPTRRPMQGEPGRPADHHLRPDRDTLPTAHVGWPTRCCSASQVTGVGHVSAGATCGRPCGCRRTGRGWPATASAGRRPHRHRGGNVNRPKGASTGPPGLTTVGNDQLGGGRYRPLVIAYRNGAPVGLSDVADVVEGLENANRRLVQGPAGGDPRHPAPARRQHHRDRGAHPGQLPSWSTGSRRGRRSTWSPTGPDHPRLDPRRAVHPGVERGLVVRWSSCSSAPPGRR